MSCPEIICKRARVLHHNTFSGFQGPNDGCRTPDHFVVGFYRKPRGPNDNKMHNLSDFTDDEMTESELEMIKTRSGSKTLGYDDWIGRNYLHIHYTEYHLIYPVLNVMLTFGYKLQTMTCTLPAFEPDMDTVVSARGMEEKMVRWVKSSLADYGDRIIHDSFWVKDICFDPWNYETDEGLQFCKMLRKKKGLPELVIPSGGPKEIEHEDNFYKWDIFEDCDFETLQTRQKRKAETELEENKKRLVEEAKKVMNGDKVDEEDDYCMVCLDRPPNTMVLPCEHCVVCKECSDLLVTTGDKEICVRCRRPITAVLD